MVKPDEVIVEIAGKIKPQYFVRFPRF